MQPHIPTHTHTHTHTDVVHGDLKDTLRVLYAISLPSDVTNSPRLQQDLEYRDIINNYYELFSQEIICKKSLPHAGIEPVRLLCNQFTRIFTHCTHQCCHGNCALDTGHFIQVNMRYHYMLYNTCIDEYRNYIQTTRSSV